MKVFKANINDLIDEIEAGFINDPSKTEQNVLQSVKKFKEILEKKNKKQKYQQNSNLNNKLPTSSGKVDPKKVSEKIEFTLSKTTLINSGNYPDQKYPQFNSNPLKLLITKDLEIDQYTIM
jgi:hypothetical protein